jgi:hypothetical protein
MYQMITEGIQQVRQRKAAGRRGCIRRKYQECEDASEEMTQFVTTMMYHKCQDGQVQVSRMSECMR